MRILILVLALAATLAQGQTVSQSKSSTRPNRNFARRSLHSGDLNTELSRRGTEIAKLQSYLAKAKSKQDARQTAALTKAIAGLTNDQSHKQTLYQKMQKAGVPN